MQEALCCGQPSFIPYLVARLAWAKRLQAPAHSPCAVLPTKGWGEVRVTTLAMMSSPSLEGALGLISTGTSAECTEA